MIRSISLFITLFILLTTSCREDEVKVLFDDTPFSLRIGNLPEPNLPQDNPLTIEGVKLGRMLFYETALSKDGTQSCASCHRQPDGFSDSLRLSIGVEGLPGKRQAMPIFNMAWHTNQFFWDGRANQLRDQAILPIQDPLEMNETLDNVLVKLSDMKEYQDQFKRAFDADEITIDLMALAMEQFMLSIVSHDSKYDQYLRGEVSLTPSEERGRLLFETEYNPFFPDQSGADCAHCHGGRNFENDLYMNNGLDEEVDIKDIGREKVTASSADKGKFKVPSLRNIAVTAPYMHDGRFSTLEEVLDHYNEGIKSSSSLDITLQNTQATGLLLDDQEKQDIINFLKTLTDPIYLSNPEYADPF